MKFKRDSAANSDAGSSSEQDAYWLEMPDGVFLLKVDGVTRAGVLIDLNIGEILRGDGGPSTSIVPPDSEVVFDAVEKQLGLGRVSKFRGLAGSCRADWRGIAETRAEHFRKAHPPKAEAEHYCTVALHFLDQKSQNGLLSAKAGEARRHLQQVAISLKAHNHQWTPEAGAKLSQANQALWAERLDPKFQQALASLACRKAVTVLERQGILKPSTEHVPDPRRTVPTDASACDIPSKSDRAFWQVHGDGMFSLEVNGQTRARIGLEVNTATILGMGHSKYGQISAPDSEVIFDVVEKVLGQGRITEFRTETGVSDIDWRGMAERQAEWFRRDCPPQAEAEFYCRAAARLLGEKSLLDGLSREGAQSHHHLREALQHLGANAGKWTREALDHLGHAQQFMRNSPMEVTTPHEPEAHFNCEKAATVLERDGIIAHVAEALAAGQATVLQGQVDACWVDLGRGRYGLLIDGEQLATAQAGLNTVSVRDSDTLHQETIAVLDSETTFDAAETRLGIEPVTTIMPEHREKVRGELAKLTAEFRQLHPHDAEPHLYIGRALECLSHGTDSQKTDIETARLHLEKALAAAQEGDSHTEVEKQVDHALQYLPSLSSPSDGDHRALSAAADCSRALRPLERNLSLERASPEVSHSPGAGQARDRTRL